MESRQENSIFLSHDTDKAPPDENSIDSLEEQSPSETKRMTPLQVQPNPIIKAPGKNPFKSHPRYNKLSKIPLSPQKKKSLNLINLKNPCNPSPSTSSKSPISPQSWNFSPSGPDLKIPSSLIRRHGPSSSKGCLLSSLDSLSQSRLERLFLKYGYFEHTGEREWVPQQNKTEEEEPEELSKKSANGDCVYLPPCRLLKDGNIYIGHWCFGHITGPGILLLTHSIIEGTFLRGQLQGRGRQVYDNPAGCKNLPDFQQSHLSSPTKPPVAERAYLGSFLDGLYSGPGVYINQEGARYSGLWAGGLQHGQGREIYASGEVFEGGFVKGHKEGYGVYQVWERGGEGAGSNGKGLVTIRGYFRKGVLHGQGRLQVIV